MILVGLFISYALSGESLELNNVKNK